MSPQASDLITLGHRIRHFRAERGLTLDQLGERVNLAGSQLSLIENGRREPKLSALQDLAGALGVELAELLSREAPNNRAALEIELDRAQKNPLYGALGLPQVKVTKGTPMAAIESLLGLHRELARRANEAIATPEEARRANTELRERMREEGNYLPDIEELVEERVRASGHVSGALTHREVSVMAEQLGFSLVYVNDLPNSTRSVTDLVNGRIYLPPASIPGGHGLRSMALQAMGHRLLGHERPGSYAEFLWQRLEINYFAAACLMPRDASVAFLSHAKAERELSVEDFRDAFGVTHEAAALRLTNLATSHLEMPVHFLRVNGDGALQKGYENDGLPFPSDVTGSIEGQFVCKQWSSRSAFTHTNRTTEYYQYTDTPAGTFWSATQTGVTDAGEYSISVGVPFAHAKWFRGRETVQRAVSRCPDESCCRRPNSEAASRWAGRAWPSARLHANVLSPLPSGTFPGVDDMEVYEFLERHAAE
ncbi:XRE family transcriptional regulator [Cryobacterium roopkundense]|uniref:Transcriptional regulator with XRE-family HTH domain n=1 Tax=Cryobacterium roopkundense TaxID=1001240 RepID=A0A099J4V5_9MICO|nr:helix-turn-helix transcriptional regulator [Cryobacterium roopkundense]KGJ72483.1 XRE family transcriptional regulator [Cryobacterium roopkundense]MBB5642231.1 transcriptional regulator with XRE-family HTH domain [Cryobacterium roopkundense]